VNENYIPLHPAGAELAGYPPNRAGGRALAKLLDRAASDLELPVVRRLHGKVHRADLLALFDAMAARRPAARARKAVESAVSASISKGGAR